jgi:Glycosyl hydrolase family 26
VSHRKRRSRRQRAVMLTGAAVATLIVVGLAVASFPRSGPSAAGTQSASDNHSLRSGGASPSPSGGAQAPGGQPSQGASSDPAPGGAHPAGTAWKLVPSAGAYLGAYVEPAAYTPAATIAAVRSFQQTVGAPITLVHTYHPWDSPFPNSADRYFVDSGKVLLLTWSGTPDTKKIIAGDYDGEIRTRAEAVKRLGHPILMEFRHEMDRPNLQWAMHGPKNFIAAWDHIRKIFSEVGADNVGWVWCPTGWGFSSGRAQAFYPGNSEVDWVCADIYSATTSIPLQVSAEPFLKWAKGTGKPIMIGEFAASGSSTSWPNWLLAAGELASTDKQIKGMAYFDANGTDSQGRSFQYWLGDSGTALRTFGEMLSWPAFHPITSSSR